MQKGTIKFFNDSKGFGFIKAENGEDIFFHVSGLKCTVQENDRVAFDTEKGKKGLNAVNIVLD